MDLCFDELDFEEKLKRKALEDMKRAVLLIPNRLNWIRKSGIFDFSNYQNLLNKKEIQSSENYTKNERICEINLDNSFQRYVSNGITFWKLFWGFQWLSSRIVLCDLYIFNIYICNTLSYDSKCLHFCDKYYLYFYTNL